MLYLPCPTLTNTAIEAHEATQQCVAMSLLPLLLDVCFI